MSQLEPRPGQLWAYDYDVLHGGRRFTVLVVRQCASVRGDRTYWTVRINESGEYTTCHWPDIRWRLLSDA